MAGYTAITFTQLKARLAARYESVPFWTDTEAGNAINEALLTWGLLTGRWKTTVTIPVTANTYELVLPDAMTYRMRFAYNGVPLDSTNRFDLDHGRPRWRQETTTDGGAVPTRPTLWAPVSLQLVYIWPMAAVGGANWTVAGVQATPTLTAGGDTVDLAEADVSTLLGFALHVLTFKKGGPWFAATQRYFRDFIIAAGEENSLITTSQWYRRCLGLDDRSFLRLKGQPSSVAALAAQAAQGGGDQ